MYSFLIYKYIIIMIITFVFPAPSSCSGLKCVCAVTHVVIFFLSLSFFPLFFPSFTLILIFIIICFFWQAPDSVIQDHSSPHPPVPLLAALFCLQFQMQAVCQWQEGEHKSEGKQTRAKSLYLCCKSMGLC